MQLSGAPDVDGRPFASRGRDVLATNGLLHDDMLGVIADFVRGSSS